jgi:hypothetical protein
MMMDHLIVSFPLLLQYNKTRQAIYVQRNIEARSCEYCWREKAISVTYSVCLCPKLAGKAYTPCYIVICGLTGSTMFFNII